MFRDLDKDGVRDTDEPGVTRLVQLLFEAGIVDEAITGTDGSYVLEDLPSGDYELVTELDGGAIFCLEPIFPDFNPLEISGCSGFIEQPWNPTTAERISVKIGPAKQLTVDFGGYPVDQNFLLGRAVIEDDYAPPGTVVEALVDGVSCGSGAVASGHFEAAVPVYYVVIAGSEEQAGCPAVGDAVTFELGGHSVIQQVLYSDQQDLLAGPGRFIEHLTAMQDTAWYWAQQPGADLPPAGTLIKAVINGVDCGETTVTTRPDLLGNPMSGFSKFIVRSERIRAGCGRPGAPVEFLVDGRRWGSTEWSPGVMRITLRHEGTATPVPSPAPSPSPAALPPTGGIEGAGAAGIRLVTAAGVFITLGALVVAWIAATGTRNGECFLTRLWRRSGGEQ